MSGIFAGTEVPVGDYPWLTKTRRCTGALISPYHVLTAAHCYGYSQRNEQGTLEGLEFEGGPVRLGHPDFNEDAAFVVEVEEVVLHPEYMKLTVEEVWGREPYDIAVLRLAEPVYLSEYLLLPARQPVEGELVFAASWGQTEDGFVSRAREAVLQVRDRASCFGGDDKRFCSTGGPDETRSNIGAGDSGGPVFVAQGDRFMGLGINSTSNGDRSPNNTFASHAATFAFVDWVLDVADGQFHCPEDDPSQGCVPLVDECATGLAQCSDDATCRDENDGFTCECDPGYEGDGFECADVDECADGSNDCSPNARCENTVGSFECSCAPGYRGDGFICEDVDECAEGSDDCSPNGLCANTPGEYACACATGYRGDGVTCVDVDECSEATNDCSPNAVCQNTEGSFTCECAPGFSGDGRSCTPEPVPESGGCSATSPKELPGRFFTLVLVGLYAWFRRVHRARRPWPAPHDQRSRLASR